MSEKITDEATLVLLNGYDKMCDEAIREAKANRDKLKQAALNQWARDNAEYQVGDIITANDTIIQVERLIGHHSACYGSKTLYVEYRGPQLTKKLQPRKDGQISSIYGDGREIKKINIVKDEL
jgi:hypothetical protein